MDLKKIKHIVKSVTTTLKTKNVVPIQEITDNENVLTGKVALITGGSGGIGFAIAKKFIKSGCNVIIAGRHSEKLIQCCNILENMGGEAKWIILDFNKPASFTAEIEKAVQFYGHIDILVNSAGVHSTKSLTNFYNITKEEYDNILNTNLRGTYFISQVVAKYMIDNKIKGHILNISSSTGAEPAWSPYRISKLGIEGFTKGLAQTLTKQGITVNGIAPGSTATGLLGYKAGDSIATFDNEKGRYVVPSEIAEYAKILVSTLGDMVVGETLYVSGGRGTYDIR
ncbi:MAG: SDR family NAD(P)-dependent oxidoreductase [Limosilactobacillus sp.]